MHRVRGVRQSMQDADRSGAGSKSPGMYSLRTVQKGMRGTCDPLKILLRIKSGNLVSFEKISGKIKYVERIFCNYLLQYRAKGGKI